MENKNEEYLKKLRDPKFYLENLCKVKYKVGGVVKGLSTFKLNEAQKDLYNTLKNNNRIIILKARQLGFSTGVCGYFYHNTIMNPGTTTALIGYNTDVVSELLDKIKTFWKTTPDELRPAIQYNSKYEISFPKIGSKILILPSTENVGSGYTFDNCLHGDTKILLRNGFTKKISEIKSGDEIINGKGGFSIVYKLLKNSGKNKKIKRIKIYGTDDLVLTDNHKILTKNEIWKEAGMITKDDYIAYPYSQFKKRFKKLSLLNNKKENYCWLKIKNVCDEKEENYVYDICLDNEPHSFLTTSGVVHNCLLTELPKIDNAEEKMMSLMPAIPINAKFVIESSPKGIGNLFHRMWMDDNNGFVKKKYGWWWGYSVEEIEQIKKGCSPDFFQQEYACKFLSGGRSVFGDEIINKVRDSVLTVGMINKTIPEKEFVVEEDEDWIVYRKTEPGEIYVISADIAEGLRGGDYSVATIFNRRTGEEVAFFRKQLPPDIFGEILDKWGRRYNNALMIPESNNHGIATIGILKKLSYPSLYFRPSKVETISLVFTDRIGWRTTGANRGWLIDDFIKALREDGMIVHSKILADEISVFNYDDNGNMQPVSGHHDDSIFAAAIANQGFKVLYTGELSQIDETKHLPKSYSY
jgi:hypothetical protein